MSNQSFSPFLRWLFFRRCWKTRVVQYLHEKVETKATNHWVYAQYMLQHAYKSTAETVAYWRSYDKSKIFHHTSIFWPKNTTFQKRMRFWISLLILILLTCAFVGIFIHVLCTCSRNLRWKFVEFIEILHFMWSFEKVEKYSTHTNMKTVISQQCMHRFCSYFYTTNVYVGGTCGIDYMGFGLA